MTLPAAAFQDGAGEGSNFLAENGDAIWLYDGGFDRVDFVAWGSGISSPPPEWDAAYEIAIGGSATARGQSISLTPNGVDGNTSACWEPTKSGDAAGRCTGYLPTADLPPSAQLWTPGVSNQGPSTNQPPGFDQDLLDRTDAEGTPISIAAPATDPDVGDTLLYSASGLPPGLTIAPGTGLITGTLSFTSAGSHLVKINVTDDGSPYLEDNDKFVWTITDANRPPVFDQDITTVTAAEGTPISIAAPATDPDIGDTLLYSATGLPPGLTIAPGTGLITGTLSFTSAGSHLVDITVTDNGSPNLSDLDSFTFTVTNTNGPPVVDPVADQSVAENDPFSLTVTASDPDLTIPII